MGKRYGGSLPDPYVPEVAVPDFAAGEGRALSNVLKMGQLEQMGQEAGGERALRDALKRGVSEDQIADELRRGGHWQIADKFSTGLAGRQKTQADASAKLDEFIRSRASLAKSQEDWDMVLGEAQGRFGISPDRISPLAKTWTPDLGRKLALGGLTAYQQIDMEFKKAQEARAQQLHGPAMENAKNRGQKIIMVPGPDGFTKVPHVYDAATGEAHPVQIAPQDGGQAPAPQAQGAKQLDADTAKAYLQKAGGDKEKARALARADGYSF